MHELITQKDDILNYGVVISKSGINKVIIYEVQDYMLVLSYLYTLDEGIVHFIHYNEPLATLLETSSDQERKDAINSMFKKVIDNVYCTYV